MTARIERTGDANSPLSDIEYLARSAHRVTALSALARRPQSRADLLEITGVSQSTIGRTLRDFEDREWIHRDGRYYEETQLGSFVVAGMQELIDRLDTEQTFRDIWRWLPTEASGFTLEMWADAVVTTAESADPYRPVNQFLSLLQDTDRFRFIGFTLALLEPCMEDLCQRITEGMEAEIIDPPSVVEYIRTTYPDQSAEALESGNLTVRVHDDLPSYGVGIVDDRVAVSGYDPDSGTVQVLIETDAPEAREWAESIYRSYRRENPTLALERPDS
jgi:predicted transcriptional regulator